MPPILVPNVEDMDELAHHISVMFYITAGVATLLFVLVVFGKICHVAQLFPTDVKVGLDCNHTTTT